MTNELKLKLQQQYNDMYKTDWGEIFGSIGVGIGFLILTYLYFKYLWKQKASHIVCKKVY